MHRTTYLGYLEPNSPVNQRTEKKQDRQSLPSLASVASVILAPVLASALLSACVHAPPRSTDWQLCPSFRIRGKIEPGLNETEKNLVCGDPKQEEWSQLPRWQAEYNFKNFLQDRALYRPKFITEPNGEVLVDVGEPTRVSKVTSVGAPEVVDISRRRFVVGSKMTPALMSDMEGWVSHEMKVYGYPCPKVKAEGDPETGELRLNVERGPQQKVVREIEQQVPGMDPGVLSRFHAFGFGDTYNDDLVTLSSLRVMRQGLFDSDYFISTCGPDGATVQENVVVAPPRLVAFGAGIDTEGYVQGRASWTNARLGRKASVVSASVSASSKIQQLNLSMDWYAFEAADRKSIRPSVQLMHDNEDAFEVAQATAQLAFQKTWEWPISKGIFLLGPQFQQVHTFRGTGPANSRFLMLASQLEFMSHNYELYLTQPRSGFDLVATADFSKQGIVTSVTAQRLGFHWDALFNVFNKEPPLLVFGLRGSMDTTLTPSTELQQGAAAQVPPTFTYFLGGSRDLRGFGRLSLPSTGVGALTSIFSGLEARIVKVLPYDLEPFLFGDAGALGPLPFTLHYPIYYSPGFGMRWASPFGAFRTTLARGFPLSAPGGWQFYFSFGEEF
jgi:translocation and assembly module TamA